MAKNAKAPVVAVSGIVLRGEGGGREVLVVERGRPPSSGIWTFPGGKVHPGELIREALEREIFEETGLRVRSGALVQIVELLDEGFHYVIHEHLCALVDADAEPHAQSDVSAARFVTPKELAAMKTTELTLEVLSNALAMAGSPLEGKG